MPTRAAHTFPFSAIVGQETLKRALLLNAVDSRVGGVLIRGEKGTAKSTAVRALASILPPIDVVSECRFGCDPGEPVVWCDGCRTRRDSGPLPKESRTSRIVDLPVSATEDRLVGTLDFEVALKQGERAFHPGLLAEANRGILYVDEVNLLDDHLVDTLLDAAAMGVNTVEREGISHSHPARFILVGTMNPEEGDIRPQLLDRFGLCVEVEAIREPEARVEIMRRRHAFEEDPGGFARTWADAELELQTKLKHARLRVGGVKVNEEILYAIADLSIRAQVDGHRADSVMSRAAAANAALEGRSEATLADIESVAHLVLAHRLRRTPLAKPPADTDTLRDALVRALTREPDDARGAGSAELSGPGVGQSSIFEALATTAEPASPFDSVSVSLESALDRTRRSIRGKRQETIASDGGGRYVRAEPASVGVTSSDIAVDATIRSAAMRQSERPATEGLAITVAPADLHKKVRTRKVGACIVLCVDASGSMGAASRMEAAKAAALELLVDAYQRRDRVALVTFRGESADVVLPPTASIELANLKLRSLPTGGATPLASGIVRSLELLEEEIRRNSDVVPWLMLLTDGRGNVGLEGGAGADDARSAAARLKESGVHAVVIDTGGSLSSNAARDLARDAGAEYVRLRTADPTELVRTLRSRV